MPLLVPLATHTFRDETLYTPPLSPENATRESAGPPEGGRVQMGVAVSQTVNFC